MADALFILITVAFFALAVGFVQVCDRIIGPDAEQGPLTEQGEPDTEDDEPEPAPDDGAELTAGAVR